MGPWDFVILFPLIRWLSRMTPGWTWTPQSHNEQKTYHSWMIPVDDTGHETDLETIVIVTTTIFYFRDWLSDLPHYLSWARNRWYRPSITWRFMIGFTPANLNVAPKKNARHMSKLQKPSVMLNKLKETQQFCFGFCFSSFSQSFPGEPPRTLYKAFAGNLHQHNTFAFLAIEQSVFLRNAKRQTGRQQGNLIYHACSTFLLCSKFCLAHRER